MSALILDPIIPYVGPLGGGRFSPKNLIKLQATVPPYAYGFDINLQCGPTTFPHDDIAMQISVRCMNKYITLNSTHQGIWGKEIRFSNVPIIEAGQKFEIIVLCEFNQYKIIINDEQYIFPQRIRYEMVTHLSIDGDVSISRISYESLCDDSIYDKNSTVPLRSTVNQLNNIQDFEKPPSYESAVNNTDNVESQTARVDRISIFHFQRFVVSSGRINLASNWKTKCAGLLGGFFGAIVVLFFICLIFWIYQ